MVQVAPDRLEQGRDAAARHAWSDAYTLLKAVDEDDGLGPEDRELFASAAMWSGRMEEAIALLERAYSAYAEAGNRRRAAYVATSLAHETKNQLQFAIANGWLSRAQRLLEEEPEAPEHGYWELEAALVAIGKHDFDGAIAHGRRAEELGRRFGDRSLEIRGLQRRGTALIGKGDVADGKRLLDEASAAALGGELDPMSTLAVYCNTIGACRDVADFDSAGEWTERANEFCSANSIDAFPGLCRVNVAEVMKFKGRLADAAAQAGRAGEELRTWCPRIAGAAFYELGEIRLKLGDLARAEQGFREADEYGVDPEPGVSLLRLAQGNVKGALASIRRAFADETLGIAARARRLPAAVEIAIAAGELDLAEKYSEELAGAAATYETSAMNAAAAFSRGALRLARGDSAVAFRELREARRLWDATGATYEVARTRELLGRTARSEGDEETARWELEAAAARFERLGAVRDADRVAELLVREVATQVMKTFLFTDIVSSTDLLQTMEDRHWANALRRHDDTLRAIFGDYGGQVVDHTGDGFFVAFDEPAQALQAAVAAQRAIDQEFVFDVRIGVHTDGAIKTAENYHGRGVHAAARIGAAAAGREILASRDTMRSLPQFAIANEREVELKGFRGPVAVCSVEWRAQESARRDERSYS